jgi:DNA polymerase-3 subunit delta'
VRLADVLHQERAISILRRALRSGRTHHAYLFAGPEGVGKELAARALAARLLCEGQIAADADACGRCAACGLVAAGNHPDLHVIDRGLRQFHPERKVRQSKGLFLGVDLIRHFLIEPATTTPMRGRARVFLVREAERMNEEAQNALLKTLEEPPGRARLILVTSSALRLLPTIRSRCQLIPFDLLPTPFVQQRLLAAAHLSSDEAVTLARLSGGQLGAALSWQRRGLLAALAAMGDALAGATRDDPEHFGKLLLETAGKLIERPAGTAEAADEDADADDDDAEETESPAGGSKVKNTDELREALRLVFMLIAAACRDALALRSGGSADGALLPVNRRLAADLARHDSPDQLDRAVHATAEAERMLDRNVAPALTCEWLSVALGGAVA